jgi:hypothetical protein
MKTDRVLAAGAVMAAICGSASAETLSARSGKSGNVIAEARVDSGGALRGLMILEKADRPCVVQIYGNLAAVKGYEGRIDKCKGNGPTQADGPDSYKGQVFLTAGSSYATGLKVCLSGSDRVKGWTIYGRSDTSPNTISDAFQRPNCPMMAGRRASIVPRERERLYRYTDLRHSVEAYAAMAAG